VAPYPADPENFHLTLAFVDVEVGFWLVQHAGSAPVLNDCKNGTGTGPQACPWTLNVKVNKNKTMGRIFLI
jgi:hypothetical protein